MGNVIIRPCYNRPEMFALSLEYEQKARKEFGDTSSLTTLFVVEHGAPDKVLKLIDQYPFEKEVIMRKQKLGLTINILEGLKVAFNNTDQFVIYIEDDILIHKSYFQYMKVLLKMIPKGSYSVLSAYCPDDGGGVDEVYKGHHYAALAPLISKEYFMKFVAPHAIKEYYINPPVFITKLNNQYKAYWGKDGYKYKNTTHWEQAGLQNRAVDIAMIEDDMHVIMPKVNRQQHIGYFGKNRPGGIIPGYTYDERLENLKEIIKSVDKMYEMSSTKQYKDYKIFSPKLDDWDGTLKLV